MMATEYQLLARHTVSMTSLDEFNSSDGMSTRSGMTSETASLNTPNDSPFASVEVVSSDMDAVGLAQAEEDEAGAGGMGCSTLEDDFATPRPRQAAFSDASAVVESPSKFRPMSRVVVKAKTLVKALVRRRKGVHKVEGPSETMTTSASSSAVPGGWRDTMRNRPVMSILVRSHTESDLVMDRPSKRMLSDASNTSTTGIYTPEHTNTPNPSLDSLVAAPGCSVEAFPYIDEATVQSLAPVNGIHQSSLFRNLARVVLFVPWCMAVGGTVLLFPRQLDRVVFRTGYVDPIAPGLRRFQFWHEMAADYVKIFLFTLAGLWSLSFEWGAIISALVAVRFAYVWQRFEPQTCCLHERVGVDDMESLWIVVQDPDYLEGLLQLAGITEEDLEQVLDKSRVDPETMQNEGLIESPSEE